MGVGESIAKGIRPVARSIHGSQAAGGALRKILEYAIDGIGPLPSAKSAAAKHLGRAGDIDDAIESIIASHIRLAGAQGFVTNLGGFAMTAVALPANIAAVAIVQVRLVACIAHLRGYDINDGRVRTAMVMCLLGNEGLEQLAATHNMPSSPLSVATAPVFDLELDKRVAERVISELTARVGGKRAALLVTRRVPVVGGGVGAVVDGYTTRQIGVFTKTQLVRRRSLR